MREEAGEDNSKEDGEDNSKVDGEDSNKEVGEDSNKEDGEVSNKEDGEVNSKEDGVVSNKEEVGVVNSKEDGVGSSREDGVVSNKEEVGVVSSSKWVCNLLVSLGLLEVIKLGAIICQVKTGFKISNSSSNLTSATSIRCKLPTSSSNRSSNCSPVQQRRSSMNFARRDKNSSTNASLQTITL